MERTQQTDPICPAGLPGRGAAPIPEEVREASELLRVVGDLTRMRLLFVLLREGELSVGGLQNALGMSQSAVSHQLRVLRDARLVGFERIGKTVRYSLADDHVRDLLRVVLEHARHE
jgi:ArsR family transcriptional regulator